MEVKSGEPSSNTELIFWSDQSNHPTVSTPHPPNPPQSTNFANFGLIWMKLGVAVKNGKQSLSPEFKVFGVVYHPPTQPTTMAKTTQNASSANFDPIMMKFFMAFKNGE